MSAVLFKIMPEESMEVISLLSEMASYSGPDKLLGNCMRIWSAWLDPASQTASCLLRSVPAAVGAILIASLCACRLKQEKTRGLLCTTKSPRTGFVNSADSLPCYAIAGSAGKTNEKRQLHNLISAKLIAGCKP